MTPVSEVPEMNPVIEAMMNLRGEDLINKRMIFMRILSRSDFGAQSYT